MLTLKNYERKIKPPFMIHADFENISLPKKKKRNRKENEDQHDTSKYQKHVACSYGYKFVCVDDTFIKPFKSYLDEDVLYNIINIMVKESQYCSDVTKNYFEKEIVMTAKC